MARGLPAVWSSIVGLPFVGFGGYLYLGQVDFPPFIGLPFVAFGGFVVLMGLYIHFVAAPEAPTLRSGETVIDTRNPASRAAIVKSVLGFLLLGVAVYLFFFTVVPFVYPTVALAVGLYLFSTGILTYWKNTLTTYYVTDHRVIKEYRLISLVRQEIPLDKVRGVEERKSIIEALVGLGNVRISSGGGTSLGLVMKNIYYSTEFADEIRELL